MKQVVRLFLGLFGVSLIFLSNSCTDTCGECFTPPNQIILSIVDDSTGENLIKPDAYHPDSIKLFNSPELMTTINIEIFGNDTNRVIDTREMVWEAIEGPHTFYLYLNSSEMDTLVLNVLSVSGDCCTWHETQQFDINGTPAEWDPFNYYYVIRK